MIDSVQIVEFIKECKYDFVSDVRVRPTDEMVLLYIPREKVGPRVSPGYTSFRQIDNLRKKIEANYSVTSQAILAASSDHQELESAFHQLLNRRFDGKVVSFFISFREESLVDSWIEASALNEALEREISAHIEALYKESSLTIRNIYWLRSSADLPTVPALMRLVKAHQPVSAEKLVQLLVGDYPSIDERWLKHRLDALRRKDLVIWQKPGCYALTALGVSVVPTGKRRSSSDIQRALVLGRRR